MRPDCGTARSASNLSAGERGYIENANMPQPQFNLSRATPHPTPSKISSSPVFARLSIPESASPALHPSLQSSRRGKSGCVCGPPKLASVFPRGVCLLVCLECALLNHRTTAWAAARGSGHHDGEGLVLVDRVHATRMMLHNLKLQNPRS